jgi:hypothetical protein
VTSALIGSPYTAEVADDKRPAGIPRERTPGEETWRVTDNDGRLQTCELLDETNVGAGFAVTLLTDGEPMFSRRCADRAEADYVVRALHQDAKRAALK